MVCLLIAIISSYKLLAVPDLKPGDLAPFNEIAERDARVINKKELEQNRSDLIGTFVQVINEEETKTLKTHLKSKINELNSIAKSQYKYRIGNINLNQDEKEWLSNSTEMERSKWEGLIITAEDRMLSQGIIKTISFDQLYEASLLQLNQLGNNTSPARTIGSKLLASTFHRNSNLKIDQNQTNKLLEELITKQGIPQIIVKKGDLIAQKGEPISTQAFYVLDHFKKVSRSPKPLKWTFTFSEALASCGILLLIMRREKPRLQSRHALLSLSLLLIVQVSKNWLGSAASPLQLILPPTLILSQGIGTLSALAWMAVASLIWPFPVNGIGEGRLVIAAIAGSFVAFLGGKMRSRAQVLQIAVLVPLGALFGQWLLLKSPLGKANTTWIKLSQNSETLLTETLLISTILMVTVLLIPIIENTFGLLTRARLMELADQERPLLRRLSKEAPGTFEHTLTILGLAEEGARAIGVDIDLIRTGALYHDVGKLHSPEWFIENQQDGINPHEQLNDPYQSATILQAHVDEGLKLARRYRIPTPIADFIPEHQGTLKMGYFLHKAREKDKSAPENLFRYKGPTPRSKESGILMLADGCEAALRALDANSSDNEACKTVSKIVQSRQMDGQLKESSLTRAEIQLLINAFVSVWRRMHHRRLKYPKYNPKN